MSATGSSGLWPHRNGEKWLRQAFECRAGGWSTHKRSQREEAVRGPGERSPDRSEGGARTNPFPRGRWSPFKTVRTGSGRVTTVGGPRR